jgi:hypothetical protein
MPDETQLHEIIAAQELSRPGVAGPFWSSRYHGMCDVDLRASALWMLDLLERRHGPAPAAMPYNDIEFYLHEICCFAPDLMERMLRGGFVLLALETATEVATAVDGVKPILEILAASTDPGISRRAAYQLNAYYR